MSVFRGKLASEDLAATQEASFQSGGDWATTALTLQITDLLFDIELPDSHCCLFAWSELTVEHTVSGANFDVYLIVYTDDTLTSAYVLMQKLGLTIPAANARVPVSLSNGLDVAGNLALVVRPGSRRVAVAVTNNTAGTLTLRGYRTLHGFVTGDTSI